MTVIKMDHSFLMKRKFSEEKHDKGADIDGRRNGGNKVEKNFLIRQSFVTFVESMMYRCALYNGKINPTGVMDTNFINHS